MWSICGYSWYSEPVAFTNGSITCDKDRSSGLEVQLSPSSVLKDSGPDKHLGPQPSENGETC